MALLYHHIGVVLTSNWAKTVFSDVAVDPGKASDDTDANAGEAWPLARYGITDQVLRHCR